MLQMLAGMSWIYWLAFIPVLGMLVFIHELGHFLAARRMGVKVEEFGFGIPPRAKTLFEKDGVKYTINWLPLGGFVRMAGEEGNFETEGSLYSKQPWQRAFVLIAGPAMNLFAAFVLFTLVYMVGISTPQAAGRVMVQQVMADSPAEAAGLQQGDFITAVDGKPISREPDLLAAIGAAAGLTIPIVVDRDGQPVTLDITPRTSGPVKIGIYMAPERVEQVVERYGPLEAVLKGAQETIAGVVGLITFLASAIFGLFTAAPMPEGGGLTGPIGIARMTGEIAREGIDKLLYLAAAISISLGTLNLLPIPALDGGRLVFVVAEWLRGKRIPPEREALVHAVGMISLLLLMAVVSYFDVAKWMQGISPLGGG